MTLKEKFDNIISQCIPIDWENKCVVIADEFAIGFAEWFIDSEGKPKGEWSIKELLEIYKREKGL